MDTRAASSSAPPAAATGQAATATTPPQTPPAKKPPPTATKPKVKKKSGGGCLSFIFWSLIIIGGSGTTIWHFPNAAENYLGWKIPDSARAFIQPWLPGGDDETGKPAAATTPTAAVEKIAKPGATPSPKNNTATTQPATAASSAGDSTVAALQTQLNKLQRQQNHFATQLARQQNNNTATELFMLRLQLIDLALRFSGDTTTAAAQLQQLANNAPGNNAQTAVLAQAARLQNIAPRRQLLQQLREARQLSADNNSADTTAGDTAATTADNAVTARLKKLFKLQPAPATALRPDLKESLNRLELYLLAGEEAAYWQLLTEIAADDNPPATITRLLSLGQPHYRLPPLESIL